MKLNFRMAFAALALALPLFACSSGSNLPMVSTNTAQLSSYRLGAGDQLSIKVVGSEDISGDYPVSDSGTIGIPLIGDVKAAGKMGGRAQKEIADKLSPGLYPQSPGSASRSRNTARSISTARSRSPANIPMRAA